MSKQVCVMVKAVLAPLCDACWTLFCFVLPCKIIVYIIDFPSWLCGKTCTWLVCAGTSQSTRLQGALCFMRWQSRQRTRGPSR